MKKNLFSETAAVPMLLNQSINDTDTTTSAADLANFEYALIYVSIGDCTGLDADSTLALTLEHSDDLTAGNFVGVPVADIDRDTTGLASLSTLGLFGTLNLAAEDSTIYRVGYRGNKRYLRVKLDFTTGTGGISAAPVSVTATLSGKKKQPAGGVIAASSVS